MFRAVLLILYLLILIPSLTHLIRYRDVPGSRRWSVGLGIAGVLLVPTFAAFLCELLTSIFSIGLFILIFFGGIGMIFKSLFR